MSEHPTPQPLTDPKEIDLVDVMGRAFTGIGRGLKRLFLWTGKVLKAFFCFALKFWWILLIATILGGVAGFLRDKIAQPHFETEMLATTNVVDRILITNHINSLQAIIKDGNYAFLSQQLSLPENRVRELFFVRASIAEVRVPGRATRTVTRTDRDGVETEEIVEETNPQVVRIRIGARENENISEFTNAIVKFVENNSFIAEQVYLAKRINLARQEALKTEIEQLMLFQQKNIEQAPMVMNLDRASFPVVVNENQTFVEEILNLREDLAHMERQYELLRPMHVVQPFFPVENPVDNRRRSIRIFALLFFAACYITLLFRESAKKRT